MGDGRNLVINGGGPAMARVERGRTFLGGQVGGILRESRAGKIEIDAVGSAVKRFRPRVGGKSGELMPALKARGELSAVICGGRARGKNVDDGVVGIDAVLI